MEDGSDIELAAKIGKDPQELTVGDIWNSMPIEKKALFEYCVTRDGRTKEVRDGMSKLFNNCTQAEQLALAYIVSKLRR